MGEIDNIIKEISPYYKKKDGPSSEHKLTYDSPSETLEPIYFWILDFMNNLFRGNVEKITDNFSSSPGSGHFSELQGKASQMQQEASRVLGTVNNILRGVINLLYDLKEFKVRLSHYDQAKSEDKSKKEAGILALKQIWMDRVDVQRGQGSINALASGNLQFVTLRDAFMVVNEAKDVDKLDLNDRVKRILKPRIEEFNEWKKRSEQELRKRFEIEKIYLKSQVDALKLNSRWAKPYLRAAEKLRSTQDLENNPALVTVFNTILLQLTIMGKNKVDVDEAALEGNLPKDFKKIKNIRECYSVVVIDFNFRGIPNRAQQGGYTYGGRAEVTFKSYALNSEEIDLIKEKLQESDIEDALKLVEGMTTDSLDQLKIDIEEFSEEKDKKKDDSNPFKELLNFNFGKKEESKEEKIKRLKEKGIRKENFVEQYVKNLAEANAINTCFNIYDIYKKSHGMATFPYVDEEKVKAPQSEVERFFGFR